jgi:hypothetical protein
MNVQTIAPNTCVVRDTAARKGRTRSVAPGKTASRYLHYGRIILDAGDATVRFDSGEMETAFIGMKGTAIVRVNGQDYPLEVRLAVHAARFVD